MLAEEIDRKVIALVKAQYERAVALLTAHRPQLDYLAKELYEKEVLSGEEFNRMMQQGLPQEQEDAAPSTAN